MRFLVDECVGTTVTEFLRTENHFVFSVFDEARGASDEELLSKSYEENFTPSRFSAFCISML